MRRAFTLIEILVAVAVLVAIVLVCGQIFQSASKVASSSEAAGDALVEGAAIRRQMTEDLARISRDGILGIHSLTVPNNYNQKRFSGSGARPGLINPSLPPSAPIRCDQLVFFVEGSEASQAFGSNVQYADMVPKSLGGAAMVRYGHALQFPELRSYSPAVPSDPGTPPQPQRSGHDVDYTFHRDANGLMESTPLVPFHHANVSGAFGGPLKTQFTTYYLGSGGSSEGLYEQTDGPDIQGTQPEARQWLLARQLVPLGDDDTQAPDARQKRVYQNETLAQETVFPFDPRRTSSTSAGFSSRAPVIDYGRIDLAASTLGDVREALLISRSPSSPLFNMARRPWREGRDDPDGSHGVLDGSVTPGSGDQYSLIKSLFAWPRAERTPPGAGRFDQMLTRNVLGTGVSDFKVEWTWDEGVGAVDTYEDQGAGSRRPVRWVGFAADPNSPANNASVNSVYSDPGDGGVIDGGLRAGERPWMGMPSPTDGDGLNPDDAQDSDAMRENPQFDRRVTTLGQLAAAHAPDPRIVYQDGNGDPAPTVASPALVDWWTSGGDLTDPFAHGTAIDEMVSESAFGSGPRVHQYWALFGPNHSWPLLDRDLDGDGLRDPDPSFTPWPTALRFTMTLHDSGGVLEQGKVVQFVVPLPERTKVAAQ